ncbi:glycine oxidase ThiO [Alteribacillus sp. HJP-4]|uniref:glycine oxidase ThiO n=1 Tax=Alteribacillus sp. HJP-4 TaxID=2775394 RepID=UPI0035CD06A6
MIQSYDVIIIGGGVNGCSIAYQLAKRNYRVKLLEKGRIAEEASSAAAGMLGAQSELKNKGAFFDFARTSRNMFSELVPEVEKASGLTVSYLKNGMLKVAVTAEEALQLQQIRVIQEAEGEHVEWLNAEEVLHREPEIKGRIQGALYIPQDGQVKAPDWTKALARAAANIGADLQEYISADRLIEDNGRTTGVETCYGPVYAPHVVVAAGAWSESLLNKDKAPVPQMIPVKGECVSLIPERSVIRSTIHASDFYIVPKADGSVIIGATEREGHMDKKVMAEAVQTLLRKACSLVPAFERAEWGRAWAGVRPQTADGMPYLGAYGQKGLWLAAGHYRNGILLSAVTGEWMADMIDGKPVRSDWKSAFCPKRTIEGKEDRIGSYH